MKCIFCFVVFLIGLEGSAQTFTLRSDELGGQATTAQVFKGFGCEGENRSPQLYWEHPPQGTASFAVTVYDEDAPTGSGWWHWLIFDIPATERGLKSGAGTISLDLAPKGAIQSRTDFNAPGYGGPCPPEGSKAHRYVVNVYALKTEKLGLDATANPAMVGFMLEQNALEKASLIFYYAR